MAVYAIGDLHLSFQVEKPMDIFGIEWKDYENILKQNWQSLVSEEDSVFVLGDFSWATYLEQAVEDFTYLDALNGKKILLKGNHDYWWETRKKMMDFLHKHDLYTIDFLYNNSFEINGVNYIGTKGYDAKDVEEKIVNRELIRLKNSWDSVQDKDKASIALFHHPPEPPLDAFIKEIAVQKCFYGHLHSVQKQEKYSGYYNLVSADYVDFKPILIA